MFTLEKRTIFALVDHINTYSKLVFKFGLTFLVEWRIGTGEVARVMIIANLLTGETDATDSRLQLKYTILWIAELRATLPKNLIMFLKCSLELKPAQRKGSNYRIQGHFGRCLLKWLDGSSVKEKYCKVH